MQFNAVIDVALGLTFLYLVVSLFVTVINEWISSILKLRARNLRRGLRALIDEPNLRQLFVGSATIRSIQKASGETRWFGLKAIGPSYLPGERFALALLEALADASDKDLASLKAEQFNDLVARLPDSLIKDQLGLFLAEAGQSIEALRASIAQWFDDMMDRASGVFRRWMQLASFLVAFTIAVIVNVDTMHVGRALWSDEALRAELVERAERFATEHDESANAPTVQALNDALRPFPIGWSQERFERVFSGPGAFAGVLIGWLLTAAAASLGAPFWFGTLGKLTTLRGAGNVPPKSGPAAKPGNGGAA